MADKKHIDVYLQNIIKRYTSKSDCGEFIAPSFKVKRSSDKYLIYGKENERVYDDKIGRRGVVKEIDVQATDGRYACEEYADAAFVYDRDAGNVEKPIKLMEEKTKHIKDTKERNRTYRILQIAASTSLIPNTNIASAWATPSTSTPVNDILDAMVAIDDGVALPANAIVMNYEVALNMIKSTQWKEYFKYTDSGYKDGLFSAISGLKQLGLEPKLCSARGLSTYEGTASDPAWESMLGDKVLLFNRETKPTTQSNCFMFSPYVTKDEVKKFYKNEERGWKKTIRDDIDELLVNADAGYILDNVL